MRDGGGKTPAIIVTPSEEAAADAGDSRAALEVAQFASGKSASQLAHEAAENEHNRNEKFKEHFERLAIGILWALAISMLVIGAVWLYHLVTPTYWQWLNEQQTGALKGLLTGGLIVGVLTDHFRKRLG